jgi:cellulose synthase/poly-beta-1,6-N-acetylglucosamine synthase-like glycosyltransferase
MFAYRMRKRPKLRLLGEKVPTVDVIITTCKESISIIMDTVRAACHLDYPRDRFRVLVSDDGADPELQAEIIKLQSQYLNLYYHARVRGPDHHYKAGNLRVATAYLATLPDGPAEFLSTLDADMIVDDSFIRTLMPHLLIDDRVALCSSPQVSLCTTLRYEIDI